MTLVSVLFFAPIFINGFILGSHAILNLMDITEVAHVTTYSGNWMPDAQTISRIASSPPP